jgi:hypothetical protein
MNLTSRFSLAIQDSQLAIATTPRFENFTIPSHSVNKNKSLISQRLTSYIYSFLADVAVIIKLKGIKKAVHGEWSA